MTEMEYVEKKMQNTQTTTATATPDDKSFLRPIFCLKPPRGWMVIFPKEAHILRTGLHYITT